MSIEAVTMSALTGTPGYTGGVGESLGSTSSLSLAQESQRFSVSEFEKILTREIGQIDAQIQQADQAVRKLAVGEADNLHQVMISITKAQTSFELAVQVRNRLVEGMQELMRMSI